MLSSNALRWKTGDLLCDAIINHTLIVLPQLFVASVLLEPELALTPMPSPAHHTYGAMARSQSSSHGAAEEDEEDEDECEEGHARTHETELQDPPDLYCSSLVGGAVGFQ